ncbi:MAG: hypothetical protein RR229_05145 [Oscillospiraceae bacterium]
MKQLGGKFFKKHVIIAMCFVLSSILIVSISYFSFGRQLLNDRKVIFHEEKYERTNDIVDLENLCFYLFNSSAKESSIKEKKVEYIKKLLYTQQINDNISKSKLQTLFTTDEFCSAQDWITLLYLYNLLSMKMFDEYKVEFQNVFPKLDWNAQLGYGSLVNDVYDIDSDLNVMRVAVESFEQLAIATEDVKLKANCLIWSQAISDNLKTVKTADSTLKNQ